MQNPFIKIEDRHLYGMMAGNGKIIAEIYSRFFPKIRQFILSNFGNEDDAKDTFQEALLAFYNNASKPEFRLTCQFETYLQAIARKIWSKQLRTRKVRKSALNQLPLALVTDDGEEAAIQEEKHRLYLKHFNTLSENAQAFLSLYLQGLDMKSIAQELGLASEAYARKRKFKCKEMLMKRIKRDEDYRRLIMEG